MSARSTFRLRRAMKNGKFVPVFGEPGKPFACFSANPFPASLASVQYLAP